MKALYLVSIVVLFGSLSCNVYQSDGQEFIQNKGSFANNKVVISSTDQINESFCLVAEPDNDTFLTVDQLLTSGFHPDYLIDFEAFKNTQETKIKINYNKGSLLFTCLFNLKNEGTTLNITQQMIDLGLDSYLAAQE